jgi:hypothetical protein
LITACGAVGDAAGQIFPPPPLLAPLAGNSSCWSAELAAGSGSRRAPELGADPAGSTVTAPVSPVAASALACRPLPGRSPLMNTARSAGNADVVRPVSGATIKDGKSANCAAGLATSAAKFIGGPSVMISPATGS